MSAWTEDESQAFLVFTASDRLAAAWALFLVLGLRRGEVAGLRWQDVDLEAGHVRIVHALVVGGDNKAIDSAPKRTQVVGP
jgi:integrase